ncbi:Atg28p [Arthroderma uncinatum]|uniref:Atg28p n=1 Tax=Arthroderma uncinatum TaxID=74035 RepID=UPI00144A805C|nr:Atg28p [Arthroderma uncinatum]KAF3480904.1 Atg28p [Arthroderma uncinatum]
MSTWGFSESQRLRSIPLAAPVNPTDPFIYIERQSKQLQSDLQELLDSQSRALSARQPLTSREDTPSTRSSTPTPSHIASHRSTLPVPVRQPRKKETSLRNARRGILRSIHNLLSLKEEEHDILNAEVYTRREALKVVESFIDKRAGLERSISGMQADKQKKRVDTLSNELHGLEDEIRETETRLAEMKVRHRHMVNELSQLQNSVDAKLSSYEAALSLVNSDAKRYLKTPPIPPLQIAPSSTTFFSLNPDRRTLEMAEEHWTQEISALQKRNLTTNQEIEALKEGGRIWNDTVITITTFEKRLRNTVNRLQGKGPLFESIGPQEARETDVALILKELDATIQSLECSLQLAEEKNWTLLICGIGAELEAFVEAKAMFSSTFGGHDDALDEDHGGTMVGEVPEDLLRSPTPSRVGSPSPEICQSTVPANQATACPKDSPSTKVKDTAPESDDDEPDPAWLLSSS